MLLAAGAGHECREGCPFLFWVLLTERNDTLGRGGISWPIPCRNWQQCTDRRCQARLDQQAQLLALSSLLCLGRRTVTGLLSTCGAQFADWSASYRLFSQLRFDSSARFAGIRSVCLAQLPRLAPVCLSVDDSLLPQCGPKIPGVAWRRDPQGPPFQTNLIRAQRVLQFSAVVPLDNSPAVGTIPGAFLHAPAPPKLAKEASTEQQEAHNN